MKKVISVFLALVMCLSLAVPAFAVDAGESLGYNRPQGGTVDWGPKEPDMCLTLPTEIVVYDDRSGNYTVGTTEVRNAGKAAATITDVQVSPSQGWSLSDWDATRGNVPVDAKTFSMRVFDAAVGSTGHVADTTAFPSLPKDASADMGVSFWMAPQRNIDGRPQVADVVVTAEFEDLSVHAILYDDGELVFQEGSTPEAGRTVTATYEGVETTTSRPWDDKDDIIKTVTFNCDVAPVSTENWFRFCSNLTTINGLEKLDTSAVTNMRRMFQCCSNLTSLDVSHFNTSRVTNMCDMFYGCSGLKSLNLSNFDTSNVKDMSGMFRICDSLMSIDLSSFDTRKVTTMNGMFYGCSKLTALDVSSFDTTSVTDIAVMFSKCSNLTTIYVSTSFTTARISDSRTCLFDECNALVGGNGTKYSDATELVRLLKQLEYARIDTPGTPGYFTAAPSVALLDATVDAAMLNGMAAPGLDAVTVPVEPVPELPASDGTYEVDPDTEVVEVPETPVTDPEPIPETPETPTEPSEPEEPAEVPDVPDEGPAEKPDDVPASPDVEPTQDPEPAAKPDEKDPAPDAGKQDGDGEGVPDTETPEDAQPPDTDGEVASDAPEEPGQD